MGRIVFSPSGIKGIFCKELGAVEALSISAIYGSTLGKGSSVVLGRDTRPSGPVLERAVAAGLMSSGSRVLNVGVAPTSVISWATEHLTAGGAVAITASHKPPEWNGLRLLDEKGGPTDPDRVDSIRRAHERGEQPRVDWSDAGEEVPLGGVIAGYLRQAKSLLDVDSISRARITAILDPNGGAGCLVTPRLLSELGLRVLTINGVPGRFYREIEPKPETLGQLSKAVASTGASVGFALDSDGGRLALVAEGGEILPEDLALALVIDRILGERGGSTVVVSVASSMVFEDVTRGHGARLIRAPVGEFFIVREMLRSGAVAGGEGGHGGLILPEFHLTRDGSLAAAKIVEMMAEEGRGIGELAKELPRYSLVRTSLSRQLIDWEGARRALEKLGDELGMKLSEIDGIRLEGPQGWVLARPSRTEPLIRIVAEARERKDAEELVGRAISAIKQH